MTLQQMKRRDVASCAISFLMYLLFAACIMLIFGGCAALCCLVMNLP
jgi:hypothetical protein